MGSPRRVSIRAAVLGRLQSSRHCTDSGLRHTPSLSVKVTLLVLKLQTEGQASGWALTGYGAALKECMLWKTSSCSPSPCFSLLVSPRKETIRLTEAPKFANAAQGTPTDYLALVVSRAYTFWHLRTIHICITFRSCCPRVWLLVCESRC